MSDGQVHSKIGASSMYRWSACPGSVRLSQDIVAPPSKYAEEGTRAHALAATWLLTRKQPTNTDSEMLEAVETYVNTVIEDAGDHEIHVEVQFDLSEIFPGAFGTADAVIYFPSLKLLRVYDYKHGQGILVEVENNSQLKYYGLGALLKFAYPVSEVELVIIQPRANHINGPVRRWRFKSLDLVEFAADLFDYAEATTDPKAPLNSGDHCRFCPAAGVCPELHSKSLTIAQAEFKSTLSYDPAKLSETLKKVDMLEDYAKSVRAFAYAEAEHGRCPPGWKLVAKRATRRWKDTGLEKMSHVLARTFKMEENLFLEEPTVKSPAAVEKILSKEKKKMVNDFTVSISSGLTLVEESDSRPPALAAAAAEFTKIEEEI